MAFAGCSGDGSPTEAERPLGPTSETPIVFACQQAAQLDICISDGMRTRRLTGSAQNDLGPVWSPDRSQIAFHCQQAEANLDTGSLVSADVVYVDAPVYRDAGGEICVVNAGGGELRQLTKTRRLSAAPSWSPDGEQIVFARGIETIQVTQGQFSFVGPGRTHGLFVTPVTGGSLRRLTEGEGDDLPAWSPDGDMIAFTTGKGAIAAIDASGGEPHILTTPRNAVDVGATWSPDSEWIAFTRYLLTRHELENGFFTGPARRETWVMRSDGSDQRRLTSSTSFNDTLGGAFHPRWSPDGESLAVTTVTPVLTGGPSFWFQVVVVPREGGVPRRISPPVSNTDRIGALLPSRSPDGSQLSFISDADGDFDVYAVRTRSKEVRRVTNDRLQQYDAAWTP